jgi:hypothetical protein
MQLFEMNAPEMPECATRIAVNDVLMGRGGATNNHEGNKRYRTIVSFHQAEYLAARKKDKVLFARKIVAIVKANGGRFLKQDSQQKWVEVSDKKATEKTSQALREGLDVRNHTVRPRKLARRYLQPVESGPHVVVAGWVVPDKSSAGVLQSAKQAIPELKDDAAQSKSSVVSLDGGAEKN